MGAKLCLLRSQTLLVQRLSAVKCECPVVSSGSLPQIGTLIALVIDSETHHGTDPISVLRCPLVDLPCRSYDPPAAVSDRSPSNVAPFANSCVFVMPLASNRLQSLFTRPHHSGVVTPLGSLYNDG